jgi:hypothetical protein
MDRAAATAKAISNVRKATKVLNLAGIEDGRGGSQDEAQ